MKPIIIMKCSSPQWLAAFCKAAQELRKQNLTSIIHYLPEDWFVVNCEFTYRMPEVLPKQEVIEIVEPEADVYENLDELYSQQWVHETLTTHGVVVSPEQAKGPHSIARLARALMAVKTGLNYEPGYGFPEKMTYPSTYQPENILGLYDTEDSKIWADTFIATYYKDEPRVGKTKNIEEVPFLRIILCLLQNSPKVVCLKVDSPLLPLLKGLYKGVDFMSKNSVLLSVLSDQGYDTRNSINISSQILVDPTEPNMVKIVESIANIWKIRDEHDHNHLKYLKAVAKNNVKV